MGRFEQKIQEEGFTFVIGIDEAGRGPVAGPVVAASALIRKRRFRARIHDSKKLSPEEREVAFHEIMEHAYVGVGIMNESVIDSVNILQATFMAMNRAVADLIQKLPQEERNQIGFHRKVCLLVDGPHFLSEYPYEYRPIVDGDELVTSISAASIVAKVIRDRILHMYDRIYPQYGFRNHKGYLTADHYEAIKNHGPSEIQRRTFNIVLE